MSDIRTANQRYGIVFRVYLVENRYKRSLVMSFAYLFSMIVSTLILMIPVGFSGYWWGPFQDMLIVQTVLLLPQLGLLIGTCCASVRTSLNLRTATWLNFYLLFAPLWLWLFIKLEALNYGQIAILIPMLPGLAVLFFAWRFKLPRYGLWSGFCVLMQLFLLSGRF